LYGTKVFRGTTLINSLRSSLQSDNGIFRNGLHGLGLSTVNSGANFVKASSEGFQPGPPSLQIEHMITLPLHGLSII